MENEKLSFVVPIKGMHCRSCEILIEEKLKQVAGVVEAEVDHRSGQAKVCFKDQYPDKNEIAEAIQNAGYSIGKDDPAGLVSKDPQVYKDLGIAMLMLVGAYLIYKALGFGYTPAFSDSSLPIVVLIGLTAGFSTCMALVGGLVLGISARHSEMHPEATWLQKFRPHLYFNLGRIVSFFLLGGVLGAIGSILSISVSFTGFMILAIGLVMLVMGMQLLNIFPWLEKFKLTLPKSISTFLGLNRHQKEYSHLGSMILGAGTFFLPCGFTQSMQILAMGSGSFVQGGLVMSLFALGTTPGMLSIGGLASAIKGKASGKLFKFAGLVVIVFALMNIANGFRLTGWSFSSGGSVQANDSIAAQVIHATFTNKQDIQPSIFAVKVGQPVKFIVDSSENGVGCMSTIMIPGLYNSAVPIRAGQQIVMQFTPTKTGDYPITCAMGVQRGTINVQ